MDRDAHDAQLDADGASQDQAIELPSTNGSASDVDLVDTLQETEQSTSSPKVPQGPTSVNTLLSLGEALRPEAVLKRGIAVVVYPVERPWDYRLYRGLAVTEIVERYDDGGLIEYLVKYEDEDEEVVSLVFCTNCLSVLELQAFGSLKATRDMNAFLHVCFTSLETVLQPLDDHLYSYERFFIALYTHSLSNLAIHFA